jgi:hypothetical protein
MLGPRRRWWWWWYSFKFSHEPLIQWHKTGPRLKMFSLRTKALCPSKKFQTSSPPKQFKVSVAERNSTQESGLYSILFNSVNGDMLFFCTFLFSVSHKNNPESSLGGCPRAYTFFFTLSMRVCCFNLHFYNVYMYICVWPITAAATSKVWTVYARSNADIMGSNPTQGMDACVCVVLCVGSGLSTGQALVQGVLTELKNRPGPNKGL